MADEPPSAHGLVKAELARRGITFHDAGDHRLIVDHDGVSRSLDLTNLQRQLELTDDRSAVGFFLDVALTTTDALVDPHRVFWLLERTAGTGVRVSRQLSRVLAEVSADNGLIRFPADQPAELTDRAWANLDRELAASDLRIDHIDGVPIGLIATEFVSKASLILAPGLRRFVENQLGWPVLAMVPDRDFLFLCNAEQQATLSKLGAAVVREYNRAPYPLSTEVLRVDDQVTALGAFAPDEPA